LPPFWGAAMRFAAACAVFFVAMAVRKVSWPRGRALVGDLAFGLFTYAAPFGLFYWGVQNASPATGGVILAGVPLLTILLAFVHRIEKLTARGMVGSLLAIAGFVVVFRDQLDATVPLSSLLAFTASALAFGESLVVVKWFPQTNPIGKNAIGMGFGAVLLMLASLLTGEGLSLPERPETWAAVVYLITLGSVGVFTLYLFVLKTWSASATAYDGVLIPFVTVVLAAWLLDERVSPLFAVGGALVLAGAYIGALSRSRNKPETADGAATAPPPREVPSEHQT
ncbi:MAG: DMT family transporter, partial [Actinomycetota bacterium]